MKSSRPLSLILGTILGSLVSVAVVSAWTAPTGAPPTANVSAPINVGAVNQVKNAGLSVNALTVFGNSIMTGALAVGSASAPAFTLDVTGTTRVTGAVTTGSTLTVTGNTTAAGYFHSSDSRLKENVQTSDGLSIVQKLRGVTFQWKKDGIMSAGVIAQEVEKVLPNAVHTDAAGMKTVEYDQILAPLIESIKQQQAEIESLKYEIEKLKTSN